ncbi:MAG: response regulator transcription factor [Patescibacteria group bacterium]|nr:response regulator transcription factor [Patescibacteria group bacterium]
MTKVFLIEKDKDLQEYLSDVLSENGYQVQVAKQGSEALNQIENQQPDLVLIDLELDDIKGEEVCLSIKRKKPDLPIILILKEQEAEKIIEKFKCGANDFVLKPINTKDLLLRINARLTPQETITGKLQVGNLTLDKKTHEVKRGEKEIELTPREFKLLQLLMEHEEQVLSREFILNRIWSYPQDVESRVVDVYVGYLRDKIDKGFDKKLIHTIRGFGYKIKE